jgi:hypothetical protein
MLTTKDMLISLLDSVEQFAIENVKMRVIIQSMPLAESPDFSLDDLIQETPLIGDTEIGIRKVYAEVRGLLQQRSDPELALKTLLEQFPRLSRLH